MEEIAAAAVRCFEQYGVHRTSMNDVADAADISRPTLYRIFATRTDLLAYILGQRISAMGDALRTFFAETVSLKEALIEGSLLALSIRRRDTLFEEIVHTASDWSLEQYLIRGSDDVRAMMLDLWGPVIDRARAEGRLRAGVETGEAVDWIRQQHALLGVRDDLDDTQRRRLLEIFVVPALLIDH